MIRDIAEGEIYHIFNRGIHKQEIFHDDRDRFRFLFLITHFQSPIVFNNIGYDVANFRKTLIKGHPMSGNLVRKIVDQRTIELICFILMPNHFHLVVKEKEEGGISAYMQRVLNSYTKYYNAKYKTSGHLFQGPYRIVHIGDNDQLIYTSAYVHRNCQELTKWKSKESSYVWSSYNDFISNNRWGMLLDTKIISEQFDGTKEYRDWVNKSSAKSEEFEEISKITD